MKKMILLTFMVLLAGSCVYPYDVELEGEMKNTLVVDGNILIGNTSTVQLGYLQPLNVGQRGQSVSRPEGKVYLEEEGGAEIKGSGSAGMYTLPSFTPSDGSRYRLRVEVGGKTYYSDWIEPVKAPEIQDISFTADDDHVYVQVTMRDDGSGEGYAATQYEEMWKFHADYIQMYTYDFRTNSIEPLLLPDSSRQLCWNKDRTYLQELINYVELDREVKNYTVHQFLRTDRRNQDEYHIRVKAWNLNADQYRYRKLLEENGSIGGNLFSPEPGELNGNVYCADDPDEPVFGYVNISLVSIMDGVLDSRYEKYRVKEPLIPVSPADYAYMSSLGYSPVDMVEVEGGEPVVGWGKARCYDCVAAGGTLEKPEFD